MKRWGDNSWFALAMGSAFAGFPVSMVWLAMGWLGGASAAGPCLAIMWAIAWRMRERVPESDQC